MVTVMSPTCGYGSILLDPWADLKIGARGELCEACGGSQHCGSAHNAGRGSLGLNCRGGLSDGKEGSACRICER